MDQDRPIIGYIKPDKKKCKRWCEIARNGEAGRFFVMNKLT